MYTPLISDEPTVRLQLNSQAVTQESLIDGVPSHLQALVKQALASSFIIVCQPGPNSFVLVPKEAHLTRPVGHPNWDPSRSALSVSQDSLTRRPRFHVVIGPQLCSCQRSNNHSHSLEPNARTNIQPYGPTAPCLHVLFVMLKVLQTPVNDRCLSEIPLPASKAESLIHSYQVFKTRMMRGTRMSLSRSARDDAIDQPMASRSPLAIPAAVRPIPLGGVKTKTVQLFHPMNGLHGDSPECIELSGLTETMPPKASSVPFAERSSMGHGNTEACVTRASSSDNPEHIGLLMSGHNDCLEPRGYKTTAPRPRTAPQPEPPPRLGRGRSRSIRHACSTMFRPIRDHSPLTDDRLFAVLSEEESINVPDPPVQPQTGINPALSDATTTRLRSSSPTHGDSPQTHSISNVTEPGMDGPGLLTTSQFDSTSRKCPVDETGQCCALCLQHIAPCRAAVTSAEQLIRCAVSESDRCQAIFHRECCHIWLEEVVSDGDGPHCPVCLRRWEPLPFELPNIPPCPAPGSTVLPPCCVCQTRCNQESLSPATSLSSRQTVIETPPAPTYVNMLEQDPSQLPTEAPALPTAELNENSEMPVQPTTSIQPGTPDTTPFVQLPYPEYKNCVAAFSLEIADGIASRQSPTRRQLALQRAAQQTVSRILLARQRYQQSDPSGLTQTSESRTLSPPRTQTAVAELDCLRVMLRLIQFLLDDPVDAVFIDSLRAFREILGYLVCFNVETQTALQRAIGPILRRLLRFVGGASVLWTLRDLDSTVVTTPTLAQPIPPSTSTDRTIRSSNAANDLVGTTEVNGFASTTGATANHKAESVQHPKANLRDRANLALATLVELAKGQSGALAVGRDVGYCDRCLAVCGLQHMARFILSSAKFHATHLIGRLTLLDKLIRMDQTVGSPRSGYPRISVTSRQADKLAPVQTTDRLARRHLCSSLVFARRHLLPPSLNAEMAVCFPHHYQLQVPSRWPDADKGRTGFTARSGSNVTGTQDSFSSDSLYNTQLRASRVARRVFLTAARALLTYGSQPGSDNPAAHKSSQQPVVYATHEFSPREFVEVEIDRTEAPLAAWLRNKLAPVLYPNLCLNSEQLPIPLRMAVSEAPQVNPVSVGCPNGDPPTLSNSQSVDNMPCTRLENPTRTQSLSPVSLEQSDQDPTRTPPTPPPRRNLRIETVVDTKATRSKADQSSLTDHSQYVREALEPAYDLVALSESGQYSSASECEDEEAELESENKQHLFGNGEVVNEPTYGGRSLGSEVELQTEQAAVLRSALRRCSRSYRPLLPVPALSLVMDVFRTTKILPSADEYYESIDWIRGPILGHGAFSQCYQARDTRTGLLMAVKRIRLGGGAVFSLPRGGKRGAADPRPDGKHRPRDNNGRHPNLPNAGHGAKCTAQLAEVQAEVDIMLRLNHPNVLRLFGAVYCAHRGLVDLFIEWMPGGSVTSLLQQFGAFNESVTLAYGVQVVRGLAYLHKYGILHRDLKGANLLVDSTGSMVRISDFGASARLSGDTSVAGQFQGQVIGTFSFMAPEVLRGETYGRACDIWSIGCCLIEMLTGKPPWHDARLTNRYALMFTIATSDVPPTYPTNLHADVLAVLDACFARQARDRPTASKLLTYRAFARLIDDPVSQAKHHTESQQAGYPVSSNAGNTCGDVRILNDSLKRTVLLTK